jgi:cell division protein ZipA
MEMDKTTLRIILAVLGVLLLLGIYLWDRLKRRRQSLDKLFNALETESPEGESEADEIDTISINPIEETAPVDVDVLEAEESTLEPGQPEPEASKPDRKAGETEQAETKRANLPEVIQVSIVAPPQQPFSGDKLLRVFEELGLEYGDMDIFHAYQGDEIQFSVASLVKPGTFPIDAMDDFQTRGLTLFFQPPLVSRPAEAFEHMIATCHALAQRLGGKELDDRRQPLTAVKISLWRRQLKEA